MGHLCILDASGDVEAHEVEQLLLLLLRLKREDRASPSVKPERYVTTFPAMWK
jgi:hypothetical protein